MNLARTAGALAAPSPAGVARRLISRFRPAPSVDLLALNEELNRLQVATAEANRWLLLGEQMAGIGHWRLGLPDNTLTWSDQIYRIHGLNKSETELTLDLALAAYHPEDREQVTQSVAAAIETKTGFENQTRLVRPTGEIRHVWARGVVQTDNEGTPTSLFGVFIDITEQKRAEAEQAAEHERLAQARRLEALGELAGGVAHDINNVLQTISAASAMIETKADQPGEVTRLGQLIGKTTERAAAIVSRLLVFARRSTLQTEAVDVPALLCDLKELLEHTLGGAFQIDLRVPQDLPQVAADCAQLETVLINLVTNARDAMLAGGMITIEARTYGKGASRIEHADPPPSTLPPGRYVSLSVSDQGAGMDAATLARAIEPFFTTKQKGRGNGLGLSMAAGFAEQSGGALCLRSTPGTGTCATLWLPEAQAQAPSRWMQTSAAADQALDARATILLVDDESDLRELLATELEDRGYTIVQAVDGVAARAWLQGGGIADLLVTDLSMPGLDGVSLIQAAQALHPDLPAILLTGHALDIGRLAPDRSGGCYTLLSKPVRSRTLVAEVAQLLASAGKQAASAVEPAATPAQERCNTAM